MPKVVAIEEMKEVKVEHNAVQVETMVDESGKEIRRILLVLVKEEPDHQHTTWAPETKTLGMPELPPRADVKELLRTEDLKSYDEEATDSEGYLPDNLAAPEEDTSAAESMEEEILPIDVEAFDAALKEIATGLEMAAIRYHHLRALLPQLLVHEVPQMVKATPLVYTKPMPPALISILKEVGLERVLDYNIEGEAKTTSSQQLRHKHGLQRACTEKVLQGSTSKGGSFYSKMKKEATVKPKQEVAPRTKTKAKVEVKENPKESCIEVGSSSWKPILPCAIRHKYILALFGANQLFPERDMPEKQWQHPFS